MTNDERLSGHCTMLIEGECYTFPLPLFHDTVVRGWGPGRVGEFEQRAWGEERMAEFIRRQVRHDATRRRWGWVRAIRIPVPYLSHRGWDEDGEDMGRGWEFRRLGDVLAHRLIAPAPMDKGSHLVRGNAAQQFCLIGTHGVHFDSNLTLS